MTTAPVAGAAATAETHDFTEDTSLSFFLWNLQLSILSCPLSLTL